MSVENVVRERVKRFKKNQKRLIIESKEEETKSFFGALLSVVDYNKWTKENEAFVDGYAIGLEEGLRDSFNTARLTHHNNFTEEQSEFYNKFLELSSEYNCRFTFHPLHGMVLEDLQ